MSVRYAARHPSVEFSHLCLARHDPIHNEAIRLGIFCKILVQIRKRLNIIANFGIMLEILSKF